jgi:cytochrome c oxidase assembly factor 4
MSLMSGESPDPNKQYQHLNLLPGTSGSSVLAARVSEDSQSPELFGIDSYEDTVENTKMNDCYYEKRDWRLCKNEVSFPPSGI